MLKVNLTKSGIIAGTPQRLRIVLDADTREELDSASARQEAMQAAASHGFGNGGFSETPQIAAINATTGECITEDEAFDPTTKVSGFRATYTFVNRL